MYPVNSTSGPSVVNKDFDLILFDKYLLGIKARCVTRPAAVGSDNVRWLL